MCPELRVVKKRRHDQYMRHVTIDIVDRNEQYLQLLYMGSTLIKFFSGGQIRLFDGKVTLPDFLV